MSYSAVARIRTAARPAAAIALVAALERDYAVRRTLWSLSPYSLGIGFPQRLLAAVLSSSSRDGAGVGAVGIEVVASRAPTATSVEAE